MKNKLPSILLATGLALGGYYTYKAQDVKNRIDEIERVSELTIESQTLRGDLYKELKDYTQYSDAGLVLLMGGFSVLSSRRRSD